MRKLSITVILFAFFSMLLITISAMAGEMNFVVKSSVFPDGELAIALTTLIDAVKIGQMGLIVLAIVQLLKTQAVLRLLSPIFAKWGFVVALTPEAAEAAESRASLKELAGDKVPVITVGAGAVAGIVESIATGKKPMQAIFEGVLSSGVSMALYDSFLKPIMAKFKKDGDK